MGRFSLTIGLLVVAGLLTTQSAFAARIYNFTPVKVYATGLLGALNINQVTIDPGQRSESISWGSANVARIDSIGHGYNGHNTPMCSLNFGVHAEIQGGNYMTVGLSGGHMICTLCGSSHNVVKQSTGTLRYDWKDSRTGC